jgi:hypothetical protein
MQKHFTLLLLTMYSLAAALFFLWVPFLHKFPVGTAALPIGYHWIWQPVSFRDVTPDTFAHINFQVVALEQFALLAVFAAILCISRLFGSSKTLPSSSPLPHHPSDLQLSTLKD